MTWKFLLIKSGEQVWTSFSYVRNLFAGSVLSRLVTMIASPLFFMCQPKNVAILKQPLSLKPSDDLMDLITFFDDTQETSSDEEHSDLETDIAFSLPHATINDMINIQIEGFSKMAEDSVASRGFSSAE
ncbi:unnamed protein product [Eruca vesicaria subsp. sativa]|uniref:Uncharacterized protein n=1 Tax=Eruca vesicaria subsp. sativa TaxID=29727 RepID=A0ABC8K5B7_ERUVS|nr:unnamed protein product [Eruca vesicaria subsp. sativa]